VRHAKAEEHHMYQAKDANKSITAINENDQTEEGANRQSLQLPRSVGYDPVPRVSSPLANLDIFGAMHTID
jgi:hypothetical protein